MVYIEMASGIGTVVSSCLDDVQGSRESAATASTTTFFSARVRIRRDAIEADSVKLCEAAGMIHVRCRGCSSTTLLSKRMTSFLLSSFLGRACFVCFWHSSHAAKGAVVKSKVPAQ